MIIYPVSVILSVAFILLASGTLHEVLGLRPNYVVTNTQAGRLFVSVAVVVIVGMCPVADGLTGAWFAVWVVVGTLVMFPVLNAALGPVPYTVTSGRLIEAHPPRGYQRMNLEMVTA